MFITLTKSGLLVRLYPTFDCCYIDNEKESQTLNQRFINMDIWLNPKRITFRAYVHILSVITAKWHNHMPLPPNGSWFPAVCPTCLRFRATLTMEH